MASMQPSMLSSGAERSFESRARLNASLPATVIREGILVYGA